MSVEAIFKRYPTLTAIADHPKLREDLEAASASDHRGLWEAYWAGRFTANELTFWLCLDEVGGVGDGTADEIEANLCTIAAAVGEQKVRSAYRDKLLVNGNKPFTDVRYEIGAAAGASAWFDAGSMVLEAGIAGGKKNSDLGGKRNGTDVRMEVRVVHDDWPLRIDPAVEQAILGADVPVGFSVQLRFLPNAEGAAKVRRLIEGLYEHFNKGELEFGQKLDVDGAVFFTELLGIGFSTQDYAVPITEVTFEGEQEDRLVTPPVFTRSMLDPQERDWIKNPNGVHVFSGDLVDKRTYEDKPFSTKVGDAVASKVRQCADGACNIVVVGTPSPLGDHDVEDGLLGALAASYVKRPDSTLVSAGAMRKGSGMFVPAQHSEDAASLVDPYRKISSIWHIRLGQSAPQSRIIPNPNAAVPIISADADALKDTLPHG